MRSCVRFVAAALLGCMLAASAFAQSADGSDLYKEALAREALLRKELDAYRGAAPPVDLLGRIRVLVGAYQDLDRLFPQSAYSDDALWQGGMLAADIFTRFGDALDRTRATRLLNGLVVRFPRSTFAGRAPEEVAKLEKVTARAVSPAARPADPASTATAPLPRTPQTPIAAAPPASARPTTAVAATPAASTRTTAPPAVTPPASTRTATPPASTRTSAAAPPPLEGRALVQPVIPASSSAAPATATATSPAPSTPAPAASRPPSSGVVSLRGITHEELAQGLRITINLDREVAFADERIARPDRVFIDLQNTRAIETLRDTTIPLVGQVVKQIRVGTQAGTRTRVVFDLTGNSPYSIYALYDPYRVVIDFERRVPATASAPGPVLAPVVAPPPVPAVVPAVAASVPSSPSPVASVPAAAPASVRQPVTTASASAPLRPTPATPDANRGGGFSLSRQLGLGISRIVIDPGHGGNDSGAKVTGLTEAGLVLDVALRLEKLLQKDKNVEVVLTRRTNTYVPLEERTAIANRSEADLFLSIHANANASRTVRGVETYILNFAANPEAEALAARENAGSSRSMRELPDIVQAIALNNKLDESRDFATIVQSTLYERLRKVNRPLRNLGVKQAPFTVLIGAEMPAILAEISFMTNTQEAALLKTERYRQQIAEALLAGVMGYQESLKKLPAVATNAR